MSPEELVQAVGVAFSQNSNPIQAKEMRARLEGRFEYFGLLRKERDRALEDVFPKLPDRPSSHWILTLVQLCWKEREREYQYFANDFMAMHTMLMSEPFPDLARRVVMVKPWWDTVDPFAVRVMGPWVKNYRREDVMDQWVRTPDRWLTRAALLHQLRFRERTDTDRLYSYALLHGKSADHMIRKAVGWSLHTYYQYDKTGVDRFLDKHRTRISLDIIQDVREPGM